MRARSLVVGLCTAAVVLGTPLVGSGRGGFLSADIALGARSQSHVAVADAFVSARSPKRNFGRAPTLRVGGRSHARSYLRFSLPRPLRRGGPRARLRLFATSGSSSGVAVRLVRGGRWRERSLAADSAPQLGTVVGRRSRVRAGRWLTIDISRAIYGKRTVELALVRRGAGELRFLSREAGRAQAPRLVRGEAAPRPPVVAAAGDIVCDPRSPNRRKKVPGTCLDRQTSDLLVRRELAAVLTLGDNQYETGALSAFRSSYDRTWGRVKAITRPTVGNHEYLTPGAAGYFDYFNGPGRVEGRAGRRGEGWYSFDVGDWHLVALNSVCDEVGGCGPGSPQLEWLKADLAAHPATCTLAYWHHPRFSSGFPRSNPRSDAFWRVLYDAGADVVLNGHAHDYERFAPQTPDAQRDDARGIRQFVVGTGGKNNYPFGSVEPNSEVRDAATSGVLLLTLRRGGYDWKFAPVPGGRLRDAGSGACH
ncbi:MAG TPA: DNRLRE domain-containing protein [Solirubrobacteraceae bacterium]|nr:DNRLRE domain-containing protein [Solirubrobacteraceae bacterium]